MEARRRPDPSEYYDYYGQYVAAIPDGDILDILRRQIDEASGLLSRVTPERASFRYAPGKWTLKEVVGHVVDLEWVFTARALHFARGVEDALPGVEQDDFVKVAGFGSRPLDDIVDEWRHLRAAGTRFFAGLDDDAWVRRGTASGHLFSVRAYAYIIAGHAQHHLGVMREKYLG